MFQNIKVDIIYYKTATDFEMEFNLSGCCRMRLLTDKASDKKTLINQMVRAVNRSRIIMISGTLFGDDNIITACAKAIGKPLAKLNNEQFGIDKEENIEIINNSIPLISSNGIFGGCIIEQGPQTLILLSENKDIRKNIMQNLIHPYVKDVCDGDVDRLDLQPVLQENPETKENVEETPIEEAPIEETPVEETIEQISEEVEEELEETETIEEISEQNENEELTEELIGFDDTYEKSDQEGYEGDDLVIDTPSFISKFINREQPEIKEFENESESYVVDDDNRKFHFFTGLNIPIAILIILLIAVLAMLIYSMIIVPSMQGVPIIEYITETYTILLG